jgi:23S rRNA (cytosine1962-C5)-methyltransferase
MDTPRIVLKARRAQPFFGRHPWVYAGAIAHVEGEPADGAEIELVSHAGNFIARGLFNSQSKIRARLYCWEPGRPLDADFFRERIVRAIRLRRDILKLERPGGALRLVFSEGDGLSGMTVDMYDRWLCVQFTSLALAQRRAMLAEILQQETGVEGIMLRTEKGIGRLEGVELHDEPLLGVVPAEPVAIDDHGVRFLVNLAEGQKTGFYLDQRDNRLAASAYAAGRSMLDAFCYTGGFSLHAAKAGARQVEGVDSSGPAVDLARRNAELNELANAQFTQADVFKHLGKLASENRQFEMVVLDPPKFARARHAIPEALSGYRRLMSLSMKLLTSDGIFVFCCCSGLISLDMIEELLAQVSTSERRDIQILERRGQSPDHPVAVSCRESTYLKCLICRVL